MAQDAQVVNAFTAPQMSVMAPQPTYLIPAPGLWDTTVGFHDQTGASGTPSVPSPGIDIDRTLLVAPAMTTGSSSSSTSTTPVNYRWQGPFYHSDGTFPVSYGTFDRVTYMFDTITQGWLILKRPRRSRPPSKAIRTIKSLTAPSSWAARLRLSSPPPTLPPGAMTPSPSPRLQSAPSQRPNKDGSKMESESSACFRSPAVYARALTDIHLSFPAPSQTSTFRKMRRSRSRWPW